MSLKHIVLAIIVASIWGVNFVFIKLGLETTPPLLLGFYRFAASALAVFIFTRPKLPLTTMIVLSLTMFVGQFALIFISLALGSPPGLTSVVVQSQLIFTLFYMTLLSRKLPKTYTLVGSAIAVFGLFLICLGVGAGKDISVLGIVFLFLSAACWGLGNVMLGRLGKVDLAGLVAWMSLLAIVPFAVLSLVFEGPSAIVDSFQKFDGSTLVSIFYISVISTILGYGGWAWLIRHNGAAAVAPYSLLVPVSGILTAVLVVNEQIDWLRGIGILCILLGLGVHSWWGSYVQKNN